MAARYACSTAAVAWSAVSPLTSTEPICTSVAITVGGGSARAWLDPTPRAQTTRQMMKPARLATDGWILAFERYASVSSADHHDRQIVGEITAGELACVLGDRGG